jgi:hypothetical protein
MCAKFLKMQEENAWQMCELRDQMTRSLSLRDSSCSATWIPSIPPLSGVTPLPTPGTPGVAGSTHPASVTANENPAVFGLAPLAPVKTFTPAGTINHENLMFCGVDVGPLLSASETRELTKRHIMSGEHSSAAEDVKSQMYWPHMLLDCAMADTRPDFKSLTPEQFVAGYTVMMLMYLPKELDSTPITNMTHHLNRVMTYSMVSDWKHLLTFSASFFKSHENHAMSFAHWEPMQAWHTKHLESIHLGSFRRDKPDKPNKGASKDSGDGDGKAKKPKKSKNFVPQHFLRSKKLCLKYQNNTCEHMEDHEVSSVTIMHACSLCLYRDRGIVKGHGLKAWPDKQKEGKGF